MLKILVNDPDENVRDMVLRKGSWRRSRRTDNNALQLQRKISATYSGCVNLEITTSLQSFRCLFTAAKRAFPWVAGHWSRSNLRPNRTLPIRLLIWSNGSHTWLHGKDRAWFNDDLRPQQLHIALRKRGKQFLPNGVADLLTRPSQ